MTITNAKDYVKSIITQAPGGTISGTFVSPNSITLGPGTYNITSNGTYTYNQPTFSLTWIRDNIMISGINYFLVENKILIPMNNAEKEYYGV